MKFLSAVILMIPMLLSMKANASVDCGFVSGGADNTPIWDSCISSLGDDRTIVVPFGVFHFNSKPQPLTSNTVIIGQHTNGSSFVRAYQPADHNDALIHSKGVLVMERIGILAASGTQGGTAVMLDGTYASDSVLRDLYISGSGGTWDVTLSLLCTSDRCTCAPGDETCVIPEGERSAPGIRGVRMDNIKLFAATSHTAWFVNAVGVAADAFQIFPAGGTGTVGHLTIQGWDGYRSASIDIRSQHLPTLWIYDTDNVSIDTFIQPVVYDQNSTGIVYQ